MFISEGSFRQLHTHSNYSLLCGSARIEQLIETAKKIGMHSLALTDTNGMYGLIQFAQLAKESNIKPILGVYLDAPNDSEINAVLLAMNRDGYSKICKLITKRKLDEKFSLKNELINEPENIVIITSSIELLKELKSSSSKSKLNLKNLYTEMCITPKRKKLCRELYNFARENYLPLVATNAVHFIDKSDYLLHKVLTAIKWNTTLASFDHAAQGSYETVCGLNLNYYTKRNSSPYPPSLNKRRGNLRGLSSTTDLACNPRSEMTEKLHLAEEEQYFKSPDEMMQLWKALPEAIANTEKIANECNVDLELGKYKHPKFPLPKEETSFSYLWKIAFQGLSEKYQPITEKAINRLQEELRVIEQLGFADYFLIVWDIAKQARIMNMMMLGRGSAANSLVAYCLGLTQVDPLEHNLFFERFLNLGRSSPPDIDLDFSWKERDSIVKYVFDKYGSDRVAMISTTVTFRARSAFREVAKVFGISEAEISEYSQYIPWTSAENLPHLAEKFPEARHLKFNDEPWKTIVNIAQKIAGFPRHLSIHPGGVVISPEPITNFTALEYAENKGLGLIITQPDMYPIEDLGLVKIDLLSQRSLAVVKDTMEKVRLMQRLRLSNESESLDSTRDEAKVFELKKG